MAERKQQGPNWALIIVLAVLSFLAFKPEDSAGPAADNVAVAFDTYERLWRESAAVCADKLEAGSLLTEREAAEFLGEASAASRRAAFESLARAEAEALNGKWTPERHAAILREYSGE